MTRIRLNGSRYIPVRLSNLENYSGNMLQEFDQLFNHLQEGTQPNNWMHGYPVDLYETDETVVLQMAAPGIQKDDLDITLDNRNLMIKGHLPNIEEAEQRRYVMQSIPRGHFERSLRLPVGIDVKGIEARTSDGLLTLTMPKLAEAKSKKIEITTT